MNRAGYLISVAFSCVATGAIVGLLANLVNGAVSPLYFQNIMGWSNAQGVYIASVRQGLFEGLIYGAIFAAIFTSVVASVIKTEYQRVTAFRFIFGVFITVLVLWVIGGIGAVALAASIPEFYQQTFIGVPQEFVPMLRYAWVGGSIWGAMLGGVLSVTLGVAIFVTRLKKVSR